MRKVSRGDYVSGWDYEYKFFILDRTNEKKFKDIPKDSRNGYWMMSKNTLYVSCPKCSRLALLRDFPVESDGEVNTMDCIHCTGCGVHYFAILNGWTLSCARRRKQ